MSGSGAYGAILLVGVAYVVAMAGLCAAALWLYGSGHPVWAVIAGIPGAYMVYYLVRAWKPWRP